jgi:hypothetical protein
VPTIAARVSAIGPDGTELRQEIAHRFDEQTAITTTDSIKLREMVTADQVVTSIAISFATSVGAGLATKWIYDKLHSRKGAWIEIEGLRIELDKGKIRKFMLDKLRVQHSRRKKHYHRRTTR